MRPMGVRSSPFRVSLPDVKGHHAILKLEIRSLLTFMEGN